MQRRIERKSQKAQRNLDRIMTENELSRVIIEAAIEVHRHLGPGLLESIYEEALAHELAHTHQLEVERQKEIPVFYKGKAMGKGFRADLIVNGKVIVELKSVEELNPVHFKTLLTYLKLTDTRLGLLLNFNEEFLRNGIKRVVNGLRD